MKREKIQEKIINLLDEKLGGLKESLKETELSVKQAPTAMESHSDTSRFQFGQVADNLRILIDKLEKVIKEIEKYQSSTERVGLGSIVKVDKSGKEIYYYISSLGLEEQFEIDGKELRVISVGTPIAKSIIGKKIDEIVEMHIPSGSYSVTIIEIN
jgi:transcription elongation GreA/GreB family factor